MQLRVRNFSLEYFATLGGNVTIVPRRVVHRLVLGRARNQNPSLLVQYEERLLSMMRMPILNEMLNNQPCFNHATKQLSGRGPRAGLAETSGAYAAPGGGWR